MASPDTVLYVEDNSTNFRLVERLLTAEGFDVLHAENGMEGIKVAERERDRLDLILMDINMPLMDGHEAAIRIKSIPELKTVPIIAITVNNLDGDRQRTLAAGCDGYITKPIDVTSFASQLRSFLEGKREELTEQEANRYLIEHTQKLAERLERSITIGESDKAQTLHSDKLATVGKMTAGLVHELNSPLSSIALSADLLQDRLPEGSSEKKHLDRISKNVERMMAMAQGLRTFSRPSDEGDRATDLISTIKEVLALASHEFKTHEVKVKFEASKEVPPVRASESQLQHILLNLIRNSCQAVSQRDEPDEEGWVRISVKADATTNWASVRIADNGCGIPSENLERIFEPFFTTKERADGTGLGLNIVRQIIDDLGGKIEASSVPGQGTAFSMTFPPAPKSAAGVIC